MAKLESTSANISSCLSLIKNQEQEYQSAINSAAPLKDHIISLKLGLSFLEIFDSISSNEELKLRTKRVVYDMRRELNKLSNRTSDGSLVQDLDVAYTNLREKMKNVLLKAEPRKYEVMENVLIKPKTKEYDVVFPVHPGSTSILKRTSDFLLKIFEDLSTCKADVIGPLMKEIEEFKEKLILLQALLTYLTGGTIHFLERNEKFLNPLVTLLDKATCLFYSCLLDKMDEEMELEMKHKLSNLQNSTVVKELYMMVLKIPATDAPSDSLESELHVLNNLIELLSCNANSVILNDPSEQLHDMLKFLRTFLIDLPHELRLEKFNYFITSIADIAMEAIPILSSIHIEEMKEDMEKEVNGALSEVLDKIKNIQLEVKEIKLYSYPKTDELGFLKSFSTHLQEILKCRPEMIHVLKDQIETLHVELDDLRSFLIKFKSKNEHEEIEDLRTRIIHFAYQAEYVIDFYLVKGVADHRVQLTLSAIIEQIKLVKPEAKRIYDKKKYHGQGHDVAETLSHVPSNSKATTADEVLMGLEDEAEKMKEYPIEEKKLHAEVNNIETSSRVSSQVTGTTPGEVVGFKDGAEKIIEYLLGNSKQRDVASIIGMPGLGKTTLAENIYKDPYIVSHFYVRAWVTVSQTYKKKELLLTILGDLIAVTDDIKRLDENGLATKLYQSLKGQKYLIVLDDMWDINPWDDLVRSFPDDGMHSRILITSRHHKAVSHTKVYSLRQFSDVESWELLENKLFKKESFSEVFVEVGKQIAKRCDGLPLAIVVIAGLLLKVERSVDKWNQIAESLSSHILKESESLCMATIELSYTHLPDYLRACFLYFGSFPEDTEIPTWKLKLLWAAEGIVKDTEPKSMKDEVYEEYLMDLIDRCLVIASKERSNGGPKACRVHDILHDFCLAKSKEESFLQVLHVNEGSKISRVYDCRRLSIYSDVFAPGAAKPSGSSVRSLSIFAPDKYFRPDVLWISQNFKLLKVLDLAFVPIYNTFAGLELLIHLRYLAVVLDAVNSIPSSIANLWNLQSFLVKANDRHSSKEIQVPDSLWDMVNLKHVHINHYAAFNVERNRPEDSCLLENLETFSTPFFSNKEDAENLLRRLPKLKKLSCVYVDCWDDSTDCYQYPALDFLDQLISLKVFFKVQSYKVDKCVLNFPSKLEKLTLSDFSRMGDGILKIVRALQYLKVLKLDGYDWSEIWNVNDGDFPALRFLKLSNLRFMAEWIASEGSFQSLEHLVVENCRDLKEIPSAFEGIPSLRTITVRGCKPSVDDSARRIQSEQGEWGNEVKVYIYPRELKLPS